MTALIVAVIIVFWPVFAMTGVIAWLASVALIFAGLAWFLELMTYGGVRR